MDKVNNVVQSAAEAVQKVLPGDSNEASSTSHEEPLSGVMGNTAQGEPYDAGNKAEQEAAWSESGVNSKASGESLLDGVKTGTGSGVDAGRQTGPGVGNREMNTGVNTGVNTGAKISPGAQDGIHDGTSGNSGAYVDSGATSGAAVGSTAISGHENKTSPGTQSESNYTTSTGGHSGKAGAEGYDYHSSGLKADGGNFDAAHPGAGEEAARLMASKGMHVGE